MRNLLTTQNQNCYREQIEKEAYARLTWKTRYGHQYPTCFISRKTRKLGLPPVQHPGTSGSRARPVLPAVLKPVETKANASPVLVQRSLSEAPLMRPVTPRTREELYQGFSQEGKGRCLYLRRRTQKGPEEKFDYPLLSSWDYGWRLGDYEQNYRSLANGRSGVVRNTFYARNGIFNIPSETDRLG